MTSTGCQAMEIENLNQTEPARQPLPNFLFLPSPDQTKPNASIWKNGMMLLQEAGGSERVNNMHALRKQGITFSNSVVAQIDQILVIAGLHHALNDEEATEGTDFDLDGELATFTSIWRTTMKNLYISLEASDDRFNVLMAMFIAMRAHGWYVRGICGENEESIKTLQEENTNLTKQNIRMRTMVEAIIPIQNALKTAAKEIKESAESTKGAATNAKKVEERFTGVGLVLNKWVEVLGKFQEKIQVGQDLDTVARLATERALSSEVRAVIAEDEVMKEKLASKDNEIKNLTDQLDLSKRLMAMQIQLSDAKDSQLEKLKGTIVSKDQVIATLQQQVVALTIP